MFTSIMPVRPRNGAPSSRASSGAGVVRGVVVAGGWVAVDTTAARLGRCEVLADASEIEIRRPVKERAARLTNAISRFGFASCEPAVDARPYLREARADNRGWRTITACRGVVQWIDVGRARIQVG